MNDQARAWVRTVWPGFVAWLTGILVSWVASKLGVQIDSTVAAGGIAVILLGIIYGLGRWLESRSAPEARRLGHLLLSLGVDLGQPIYVKKDPSPPPRA